MTATAIIPAARGMLMAVACVPGRMGLPELQRGGRWWRIEYATEQQAVLAWDAVQTVRFQEAAERDW